MSWGTECNTTISVVQNSDSAEISTSPEVGEAFLSVVHCSTNG